MKICIKNKDNYFIIPVCEILYCVAAGSYTYVHLRDKRVLLHTTSLKELESHLSKDSFIRCHNSYLVNVNEVYAFSKKKKVLSLLDIEIPISRRKYNDVICRLVK